MRQTETDFGLRRNGGTLKRALRIKKREDFCSRGWDKKPEALTVSICIRGCRMFLLNFATPLYWVRGIRRVIFRSWGLSFHRLAWASLIARAQRWHSTWDLSRGCSWTGLPLFCRNRLMRSSWNRCIITFLNRHRDNEGGVVQRARDAITGCGVRSMSTIYAPDLPPTFASASSGLGMNRGINRGALRSGRGPIRGTSPRTTMPANHTNSLFRHCAGMRTAIQRVENEEKAERWMLQENHEPNQNNVVHTESSNHEMLEGCKSIPVVAETNYTKMAKDVPQSQQRVGEQALPSWDALDHCSTNWTEPHRANILGLGRQLECSHKCPC